MAALRVLHVDDEPDIREVVEFSLALDPDLVMRSCASGEEALAVAEAWTPDLVLLDVMMPVMDGTATLSRLRDNPRTAGFPVVFLTVRAQSRELDLLLSLGAVGVIPKPFDPMTLAASVRAHVAPPGARLGATRHELLRRVNADLVTLAWHGAAVENGSAARSALAAIRTIAHRLADSGRIFGFDKLGKAAATLEEAVILENEGSGTISEIWSALEGIVACAETGGGGPTTTNRTYK